jgi:hypothetical protein
LRHLVFTLVSAESYPHISVIAVLNGPCSHILTDSLADSTSRVLQIARLIRRIEENTRSAMLESYRRAEDAGPIAAANSDSAQSFGQFVHVLKKELSRPQGAVA